MRLIDADALPVQEFLVVEDIYGKIGRYMVVHKAALDAAPTIEAQPVRNGRWQYDLPNAIFVCSECKMMYRDNPNFCPRCGAKMDGVEVKENEID